MRFPLFSLFLFWACEGAAHHHWTDYSVKADENEMHASYRVAFRQVENTSEEGKEFQVRYCVLGCQGETSIMTMPGHLSLVTSPVQYHQGIIKALSENPGHMIQLNVQVRPSGSIRIYSVGHVPPLMVFDPMPIAEAVADDIDQNDSRQLLSVLLNPFSQVRRSSQGPVQCRSLRLLDDGSGSDDEVTVNTASFTVLGKVSWYYRDDHKDREISVMIQPDGIDHYYIKGVKGRGLHLLKVQKILSRPVGSMYDSNRKFRKWDDEPPPPPPAPEGGHGACLIGTVLFDQNNDYLLLDLISRKYLLEEYLDFL